MMCSISKNPVHHNQNEDEEILTSDWKVQVYSPIPSAGFALCTLLPQAFADSHVHVFASLK